MYEFLWGCVAFVVVFALCYIYVLFGRVNPSETEEDCMEEAPEEPRELDISEPVKAIIKAMEDRPRTFKVYDSGGPNDSKAYKPFCHCWNGAYYSIGEIRSAVLVKDLVTGLSMFGGESYYETVVDRLEHVEMYMPVVDAPFTLTNYEVLALTRAFKHLQKYREGIKEEIKSKRKAREQEASNKIRQKWVEVYSKEAPETPSKSF